MKPPAMAPVPITAERALSQRPRWHAAVPPFAMPAVSQGVIMPPVTALAAMTSPNRAGRDSEHAIAVDLNFPQAPAPAETTEPGPLLEVQTRRVPEELYIAHPPLLLMHKSLYADRTRSLLCRRRRR